jgi:hypothetical protein
VADGEETDVGFVASSSSKIDVWALTLVSPLVRMVACPRW